MEEIYPGRECPICGGFLEIQGVLGNLVWACCRDCETWISKPFEGQEKEECK